MKLRPILGYTAASADAACGAADAFCVVCDFSPMASPPSRLHVDEVYSGGPKARTVQMGAYSIEIHRPVRPHFLQSEKPFVQLDWTPASALPPHVSDMVDIDGNGQPDIRVSFDVPNDPKAPLRVNVEPLIPRYQAMHGVGKERFSRLIVRVDNAILVRVPLTK